VRVGLFVPCYVDQLAPSVAEATLAVLERAGCAVDYDPDQTCCGQPLSNLGLAAEAARLARAHLERFARYDAVVCPSASCVATVRRHYDGLGVGRDPAGRRVRERTFELTEFLVRELGTTALGARFPHKVALLASCHGLRELGLGRPSEAVGEAAAPPFPRSEPKASGETHQGGGPTEVVLRAVAGLELVHPSRDECCGFGGAFSVEFPTVSGRMGRDRLADLAATGAAFFTATDASCLLHLDGIRRREGAGPRAIHVAEILAAS
jgi:L-lactate dehydrogenase complex protein LldE